MIYQESSNVANDNVAAKKLDNQANHSRAFEALQEIRNFAWQKAIKYRFDPVIGKMHNDYLMMLNEIMEQVA